MYGQQGDARPVRKVTVPEIRARKGGEPLAMVTAYDFTMAKLLDQGGADILLVGDSLGMVVQGHATTLPVTVEEICYHGRAVARGTRRAHVVGDLPFMSFQVSAEKALESAGKLMKDGSFESVKIEGGEEIAEHVRRIVAAGIPVMGHVGLTPQSVHAVGGFKVQGRGDNAAERVIDAARAVDEAGAFAIVLEAIPPDLAAEITKAVSVPTIGIGAGAGCRRSGARCLLRSLRHVSGSPARVARSRFVEAGQLAVDATKADGNEVRERTFPAPEHSFKPNGVRPANAARRRGDPAALADALICTSKPRGGPERCLRCARVSRVLEVGLPHDTRGADGGVEVASGTRGFSSRPNRDAMAQGWCFLFIDEAWPAASGLRACSAPARPAVTTRTVAERRRSGAADPPRVDAVRRARRRGDADLPVLPLDAPDALARRLRLRRDRRAAPPQHLSRPRRRQVPRRPVCVHGRPCSAFRPAPADAAPRGPPGRHRLRGAGGRGVMRWNMHFINTTEAALSSSVHWEALLRDAADVSAPAGMFIQSQHGFDVPPDSEMKLTHTCEAPQDMQVYFLAGHFHDYTVNYCRVGRRGAGARSRPAEHAPRRHLGAVAHRARGRRAELDVRRAEHDAGRDHLRLLDDEERDVRADRLHLPRGRIGDDRVQRMSAGARTILLFDERSSA